MPPRCEGHNQYENGRAQLRGPSLHDLQAKALHPSNRCRMLAHMSGSLLFWNKSGQPYSLEDRCSTPTNILPDGNKGFNRARHSLYNRKVGRVVPFSKELQPPATRTAAHRLPLSGSRVGAETAPRRCFTSRDGVA